jgi:hypothetical protein
MSLALSRVRDDLAATLAFDNAAEGFDACNSVEGGCDFHNLC